MRESPKLFQLWPRPTYATSGHAHTLQSFSSLKLNRIYVLALVVIVVSAIAWIVGGVVLALHWTQVSDMPHTAMVGDTTLHASLSADTSHTTTAPADTTPTITSTGTTSTTAVSQTNTSAKSTTTSQANNTTTVTVNGENIPVPDNGSISKNITGNNGTTSVHVSSGGQGSSDSNVSVQVNSTSSSTSSGGTPQ